MTKKNITKKEKAIKSCNATVSTTTNRAKTFCTMSTKYGFPTPTEPYTDSGINRKGENTVSNYFRITAYHPAENLSAIFDSNGYFEKLWQFFATMSSDEFKEASLFHKKRTEVPYRLLPSSSHTPTST